MIQKFRYHIFSSFWIKVVALLLMTIDHVSKFLQINEVSPQISGIFEAIGRIGFPLFILLLVEGVRHTKHFGKYMLRLGILGGTILVAQVIIHHCFMDIYGVYSPIIDLLLCALTIYLLKQKNKKSFLAIIPILYIITSYVVMSLEDSMNIDIWIFPFYLRSGYNIFGLLLSLGFFYAYPATKLMMRYFGNSVENLENTGYERVFVNTLMCFTVFFSVLIIYLLTVFTNIYVFPDTQPYAIIAAIFLFLYSGELGYSKKWFKYGAYVYFPLHLIIIFLIFLLI